MSTVARSRTRRATVFVASFATFLALGALAAFLAKAPIEGGVQSSPFEPQWDTSTAYTADKQATDMACTTGAGATAGSLKLDATNAYPNGWCTFAYKVYVKEAAAEDGQVLGTDLTLPTGWKATIVEGCGATVPRRISGSEGVKVKLRIDMTETAAAGSSSTFAVGNGLIVRPLSSQAPLQC